MRNLIKRFLGIKLATNYAELMKNGTIILDVRFMTEYADGHIKGSVSMPLDVLTKDLGLFKDKEKPTFTCCTSRDQEVRRQIVFKFQMVIRKLTLAAVGIVFKIKYSIV